MEERRVKYEQAMKAMEMALAFLTTVHDEWQRMLRDDNERLPSDHRIEYEESKSTIKSLRNTLDELEDWTIESMNVDDTGTAASFRPFTEIADDSEAEAGDTDLDEDYDVSD